MHRGNRLPCCLAHVARMEREDGNAPWLSTEMPCSACVSTDIFYTCAHEGKTMLQSVDESTEMRDDL